MTTARKVTPSTSAPNRAPGLRVLIAEDQADCAESLALFLRLCGHEIGIARSGPAALESARAACPDVVLLDIGLPEVNGYEVARRLRDHPWERRPLVIAVTGFGGESDRSQSAEAGIDLHLTKPVDPEQLRAVLGKFQEILTRGRQIEKR